MAYYNLYFSDYKPVISNFMNILSEYYGGVIKPDSVIIHFKPCMKNTLVYESDIYVISETRGK